MEARLGEFRSGFEILIRGERLRNHWTPSGGTVGDCCQETISDVFYRRTSGGNRSCLVCDAILDGSAYWKVRPRPRRKRRASRFVPLLVVNRSAGLQARICQEARDGIGALQQRWPTGAHSLVGSADPQAVAEKVECEHGEYHEQAPG